MLLRPPPGLTCVKPHCVPALRVRQVTEIEAHIMELGNVFGRLGELVADHQELTERLHENVRRPRTAAAASVLRGRAAFVCGRAGGAHPHLACQRASSKRTCGGRPSFLARRSFVPVLATRLSSSRQPNDTKLPVPPPRLADDHDRGECGGGALAAAADPDAADVEPGRGHEAHRRAPLLPCLLHRLPRLRRAGGQPLIRRKCAFSWWRSALHLINATTGTRGI